MIVFTAWCAMLAAPNASAQWQTLSSSVEGNVGAVLVSDTDIILANSSGIFRSTNNGTNWVALDLVFSQNYQTYSLLRIGENTSPPMLFAGTNGGGVYLTMNNGENWKELDSGLGGSNVVALVAEGTTLLAGTNDGVFLSSDSGAFWHPADTGLPLGSNIQAMIAFNSVLLAATETALFRSTDDGTTWLLSSTGLGSDSSSVISFSTLQPNGSSPLFAGTPSGAYRSTDNGESWVPVIGNLPPNSYFNTIAPSGGNLFMSSNGEGVFLSVDQGTTWNAVNTGLTDLTVYTIAANDSFLYAGTFDGLWRRPLSNFSNSAVTPITSVENSLTSYPNPFILSTTINFNAPESGVADMSIVNILGTEVARIFSGELTAGQHSFSWNANGLPDGMYECVVEMNGGVERVPIIVAR